MRRTRACLPIPLVLALSLSAVSAFAQSRPRNAEKTVTVAGEAPAGGEGAEAAARAEATRKAIEAAVLPYLGGQTQPADLERLRTVIAARGEGFAKPLRLIGSQAEGNVWRFQAEFLVSLLPVLHLLREEGLLPARRVLVLLNETILRNPVPNPASETALIDHFVRAGLTVVDAGEMAAARHQAGGGNTAPVLAAARAARAHVLVLGDVFAGDGGPAPGPAPAVAGTARPNPNTGKSGWGTGKVMGMETARAIANLRAIDLDSGAILAAEVTTGAGADVSPAGAARAASGQLLARLGPRLAEAILLAPVPPARHITLTAGPFATLTALAEFQRGLAAIPGIRAVSRRSYQDGLGTFDVEVGSDAAAQLGETLEASELLRRLGAAVTAADPWSLRVSVGKPAGQ